MQYDVYCSRTLWLDRVFNSHNTARIPQISLTGRILGIIGQICGTENQLSFCPIFSTSRTLLENPGSIQVVMSLARIQALGLPVPPADYRVYPGIFRHLKLSSRYHGSCIIVMSIPLRLTCSSEYSRSSNAVLQFGLDE
jgi:hypothetical protein